jgi:hypothetical protein
MKPIILKSNPPKELKELDEWADKNYEYGTPEQFKKYLAEIGRRGGLVKSEAKAKAVRENGKRPKKPRKK